MSKKKNKPLPRVNDEDGWAELEEQSATRHNGMAYEITNVGGVGHVSFILTPGGRCVFPAYD